MATFSVALLQLLAPSAQASSCFPSPSGIVAWWPAEGAANDIVNGNTANPAAGVNYSTGEVGQGFLLNNSTNAFLIVPASASLNVATNGGLTVEGWINVSDVSGFHPIVEWNDAAGHIGVHLWLGQYPSDVGVLYANVVDVNGNSHTLSSAQNAVTANQPQHVVLTYDQATGVGNLYVNGTNVSQSSLGNFIPATGYDLWIGHRPGDPVGVWTYGSFLGGVLDELSLYKRALTTNEILGIYTASISGKCLPVPPLSCVSAPSGIVGWWKAESNAVDSAGTNNGILENGVAFAGGEVNQSFSFVTTNGAVHIPASSSLDVGAGSGFTIEGWINPTNVAVIGPIAEWNTGSGWGTHFHIDPFSYGVGPGSLYANIVDTGGSWHQIQTAAGTISSNTFQHVALTYDKTSGIAQLFCNGVVKVQQYLGSFTPLTSFDLYLGRRPGGDAIYTFPGLIDELSVYNRALATNEVAAIYQAGTAGKCDLPTVAPIITTQPTNQTVLVGDTASFTVTASGTQPLTYHWYKDGSTPIPGGTNASLVLSNVQLSQAGSYSVVVSNIASFIWSSNALLSVTTPLPSCTSAPTNLVAWWKAEHNALDSVGTNNGILQNGIGFSSGEVGQAFAFATTNASVRVPASGSLNVGAAAGFTIEGWINPTNVAVQSPIAEWNTGSGWGVHFYIDPLSYGVGPGALYANIVSSVGSWHQVQTTAGVIASNVFQHVALTYDKASGVARLYCNGAVVKQQSIGNFTPLTSFDLYLGRRPGGDTALSFAGMIDELSLYNRALTSNEIYSVYSAGSAGKCEFPPVVASIPVITSFNPVLGYVGSSVTIVGTNFSSIVSNNVVYFGAVRAVVTSASANTLSVNVPAGATFAAITVTVNGLTAYSGAPFLPTFAGEGSITTSSLAPRIDLVGGNGPARLAIGDLDRDGKADLVVANIYDGSVWFYRNISTNGALNVNSFSAPVKLNIGGGSDSLWSVTLNDIDGDGRLDVILANRNFHNISIYQNISAIGALDTNSFATRIDIPVGSVPRAVSARDLDGDGRPDLIVADESANAVHVLKNLGGAGLVSTNSFAAPITFSVGSVPVGITVADLDGDGKPDICTANNSGTVSVLRNISTNGIIALAGRIDLAADSGAQTIAAGDLDGDGKLDLVTGAWSGQAVSVYRNLSISGALTNGSFANRVTFAAGGKVHDVAIGDLDGDGRPDIAAVMELSSQLSLFHNNVIAPGAFNTGSFGPRVDFASGWNATGIVLGDLDGDGRSDIAFGNAYDDTISIYRNITPAPCTPAPNGLVGWWRAENNALDSASTNNGILQNGISFSAGEVGQTFDYSTTNASIRVPSSSSLNVGLGAGFTIEGWINPSSVSVHQPIAEWNTGSGWGVHFYIDPLSYNVGPGALYANIVDSGGGWHQVQTAAGVTSSNVWQHVAVTYDKASGIARIFRNGIAVKQQSIGSFTPLTTFDLYLGRRPGGDTIWSFSGLIDELSVYNRALTTNEIASIYNSASEGKCYTNHAPVAVADGFPTSPNTPVTFAAAKLLLNDMDPDGDALSVISVSTDSTQGGTASLSSGMVTYTPPNDFTGNDTFSYMVSDGHGGSANGVVVATVGNGSVMSLNIVFGPMTIGGNFVVNFAGIPGLTYTIEAAATVSGPWTKVSNLTAPAVNEGNGVGVFQFIEPVGTNSSRFYRTVYPAY